MTSTAVAVSGMGSSTQNTIANRKIASMRSPGSASPGTSTMNGTRNRTRPRTNPTICLGLSFFVACCRTGGLGAFVDRRLRTWRGVVAVAAVVPAVAEEGFPAESAASALMSSMIGRPIEIALFTGWSGSMETSLASTDVPSTLL